MDTLSIVNKSSNAIFGLTLIGLLAMLPNAAQAASMRLINTRTALGGNDSVDWRVVGSAFTSVSNPFSVKSSSGMELTVSKTLGNFSTAAQTSASDGPFTANFAPDDALITTTRQTTSWVTITFSSPVLGVGTQLESFENGPFNAAIEALDRAGNILGSFSIPGIASYGRAGDNTAPFIGVLSDDANIASIRINGERAAGIGFAFNKLNIVSKSVPEPDFSAFSALAFLGLLGAKKIFMRNQ